MTTKKRRTIVITVVLALVLSMTATVFASTVSVSTTSVTLWVGSDNAAAYSNRKTVSVNGVAWVASMDPASTGKGVVCKQNRMSSVTFTAAKQTKPGTYYAFVKKNGDKIRITISVKKAPF
ncbi:flagellar basal body-associated protein FliL [Clostridiales Family XIII bacterium PM5-7]